MDLKKILKYLKINESTISMILGALVIIVIGVIAINYFKNAKKGETIPTTTTENLEALKFPTTHVVEKSEDLWKIAEKYYNSGYNWVDIAKANSISNPNQIVEGQKLIIPDVTPIILGTTQEIAQVEPTKAVVPTIIKNEESKPLTTVSASNSIEENSYTVVKGDSLWKIAVRAYGDGYKWVEIAKANKLVNPSLIHTGNVFTIPR